MDRVYERVLLKIFHKGTFLTGCVTGFQERIMFPDHEISVNFTSASHFFPLCIALLLHNRSMTSKREGQNDAIVVVSHCNEKEE